MFTIDANIFLRDAETRDDQHRVCHDLLACLHAAPFALIEPLIVLAEVAGSLSRLYRDPRRGRIFVGLLRALPNLQLVPLDDALADATAEIAADLGLRGMDAIYVATARRHGCTFVTLDDEPLRRASAVVAVRTPQAALADLERTAI